MEVGSKVFVVDESHGWLQATLLNIHSEAQEAEVIIEADDILGVAGGEVRRVDLTHPDLKAWHEGYGDTNRDKTVAAATPLPLQNLHLPVFGVEDLCSLGFLHPPALLFNLRKRFLAKQPYTYSGEICISVNPYEMLEDLYCESIKETYALATTAAELAPHIYAISASAYRGLTGGLNGGLGQNQSILVSGESGAGKTEVCKQLMSFLAFVAEVTDHGEKDIAAEGTNNAKSTVTKVLESNPLLESFGNAQTVKNDNSSRFGKFTQLQFRYSSMQRPTLVGSECITYLLEKSRVAHHSRGERTFHIFYQLLAAPETIKAKVMLSGKKVTNFHYMMCDHGGSDTTVIEGVSDANRFTATADALSLLGVNTEEQEELWGLLAGILYLGEIHFVGEEGASGSEEARIKDMDMGDKGALRRAAALLLGRLGEGLSDEDGTTALEQALCYRSVKTRHENYVVPMTHAQAVDARDALAKELYARIFTWLVGRINASTCQETDNKVQSAPSSSMCMLGLLDIFGFESFDVNRFEQLCINFCNERLQQRYVADVFKSVQQEYEEEGITWEFVEFSDNAPVLELIEGRMGLITILNEECMLAKGTDTAFTSKLTALHAEHPHLQRDRLNPLDFTVHHYAGPVKYTASGFVARNRDTLLNDLSEVLETSRKPLVQALFPCDQSLKGSHGTVTPPITDGAEKKGTTSDTNSEIKMYGKNYAISVPKRARRNIVAETVATKFKRQLQDLMETVATTRVQYIRCIKPNQGKCAGVIEPRMVLNQLRYAGVLEAIRISRSAYPNRIPHSDFVQRFGLLAPHLTRKLREGDLAMKTTRLLQELLPLTSVRTFAPSNTPDVTTGNLICTRPKWEIGRTAVYFTKGTLEGLEEARLHILNRQATTVQRYIRGVRQAQAFRRLRAHTITLQSAIRARRQRVSFCRTRAQVTEVQALWRRKQVAKVVHARRVNSCATKLQTAIRRHLQLTRFRKMRAGMVRLQAYSRRRQALSTYKLMLSEAKEQAKLENQLEALKRRLEEESEARRKAEEKLSEAGRNLSGSVQKNTNCESELEAATPGQGGDVLDTSISTLSEEQGQLLEQLRRKVLTDRGKYLHLKEAMETYRKEVEGLRAENQRVKDAHAAAGLSFTALHQHASNLQRVNKRLVREREQAVEEVRRLESESIRSLQRVREEIRQEQEKLESQVRRAREELAGKIQMYELEVQMRIKQDRTLETMINLVQKRVGTVDSELVQELVEMRYTCHMDVRDNVASRSSLIGGISSSALTGALEDGSALSRASKLFSAFGALVKGEGHG